MHNTTHNIIHVSVVIPVYKAEASIEELYRRLILVLEKINPNFEIIFVEDCGGDRSWSIISDLALRDTRVRGIQLSRNFGQHAATICGISKATGDWIITLDDDLEHQPEYIPELYQKAQEGFALVYAVYNERSHSTWRNVTSNISRWLFRRAIPSLNYEYTSFRIIHHKIAHALAKFDSPFPFVDGYLSWLTNNYAIIEAKHATRFHGTSNYTLKKLLTHTLNIFVTFSDLPLKIATWVGLGTFFIGMLWLSIIVMSKLLGGISISGYSSIMASIIIFGGIQLFILGIFGEYLGRMNFKSSKKPLFLVSKTTDHEEKQER